MLNFNFQIQIQKRQSLADKAEMRKFEGYKKIQVRYVKSQTNNCSETSKLRVDQNSLSKCCLFRRRRSCDQIADVKKQTNRSTEATKDLKRTGQIEKIGNNAKGLRLRNVSALYSEWMTKANHKIRQSRQSNKLSLQILPIKGTIKQTSINQARIRLQIAQFNKQNCIQSSVLNTSDKKQNVKKACQSSQNKNSNQWMKFDPFRQQHFKLKIQILEQSFLKKQDQIKLSYQAKIHQLKRDFNKIQSDKKQLSIAYEVLKQQSKTKEIQIKRLSVEIQTLNSLVQSNKKRQSICKQIQNSQGRRNSSNIEAVRRQSALLMLNKFQQDKNKEKGYKQLRHSQVNLNFKETCKLGVNLNNRFVDNQRNDSKKLKASRFKQKKISNSKVLSSFRQSSNASSASINSEMQNSKFQIDHSIKYYKSKMEQQRKTIVQLKEQIDSNGVMVLKCKINQFQVEKQGLLNQITLLKKQISKNWQNKIAMRDSVLLLQKRLRIFDEREKFTFDQWGNLFSPSKGNIPAVLKRKIEGNSQVLEEISVLENVWKKMAEYYDTLIKNYSQKITETIEECEFLKENYLKIIQISGNI